MGAEAAKRAWARLSGLPSLKGTQVIIDAESPLAPRGWIGILTLAGTITACVPRPELEGPVAAALADLTSGEATSPDVVVRRLPPTLGLLGPAALFYLPTHYLLDDPIDVEEVSANELQTLFDAAPPDELDESGLLHVTTTVFGSRSATGALAAACGYRRWPNDVAHLSVLTHPAYRRQGHGRHVATATIQRAISEQLLPQWRARPPASQALARSLGLQEIGAQLSLQPA